ncbi:hypothetical protein [Tautonia plasticadhaerens]|uniref:hypothetical protein n=1 Tax=Tautonia plasticadhaerens TaxID=2527974 RepID=UPI0011A991B9|nr:hypothetical protein [Tautonia plasticadhaerens]
MAGWLRTRKRLGLYEAGAILEELDRLERFDSDWYREQARIQFRLLDAIPGADRVFRRYFDLATFSSAGRPTPEFIRSLIDELIARGESPDWIRRTPLAVALDRLELIRDQAGGRSLDAPRQETEPSPEDRLELELRRRGKGSPIAATLVGYMKGKECALPSDVGDEVHDDRDASDKTIRGNLNRVNEVAEELGLSLRYRLKGGRVWKERG